MLLACALAGIAAQDTVRDMIVRAKAELRGGKASAKTVADLTALVGMLPDSSQYSAPALQSLAMSLLSRDDTATAVPIMRRAVQLAPDAPGMAGLMLKLAQQEPAVEAERLLSRVLQSQPSGPLAARAYHQLGGLMDATDGERARAAYESSLRLAAEAKEPTNAATLASLSLSLTQLAAAKTQQEPSDNAPETRAADLARQAIALAPTQPMSYVALGRALVAAQPNVSQIETKTRKEAVGALRAALSMYASSPSDVRAGDEAFVHHQLGMLLASAPKVGDAAVAEAKKSFARAAALQPQVARYTEARAALDQAIERRANDEAFEEALLEQWEGPEIARLQAEGEALQAHAEHRIVEESAPISPSPKALLLKAAAPDGGVAAGASTWDALREEGVVTIGGVLSAKQTATLRDDVIAQVERAVKAADADQKMRTELFPRIAARIRRLDFKLALSPVVRGAVAAALRKLAPTIEAALGRDPKLFELAAIVVDAGAPPQPYHADLRDDDWDGAARGMQSASVYVALQDVNGTQGPTHYLVRTNTKEAHTAFYDDDEEEEGALPPEGDVLPEAVRVKPSRERLLRTTPVRHGVMSAGDATLFDQRLLHAGSAHTQGEKRALLCISFMRRGASGPSGSLRSEYEAETLQSMLKPLKPAAKHDEL